MSATEIHYDLHMHSCLSPCGDDTMTPALIAGLAAVSSLDLIALTDHNSAENIPAFAAAAKNYGIAALYGLELTTVESIHTVCLFRQPEEAVRFGAFVHEKLQKVKNDPKYFGRQLVTDEDDRILREEEYLLPNDTLIGFNEALGLARSYGGTAFPAHADKDANSLFAVLGLYPPEAGFSTFEIYDRGKTEKLLRFLPENCLILHNSDAHMAERIGAAGGVLNIPEDGGEDIAGYVFGMIDGKIKR